MKPDYSVISFRPTQLNCDGKVSVCERVCLILRSLTLLLSVHPFVSCADVLSLRCRQ